jgi:hypothetical protein
MPIEGANPERRCSSEDQEVVVVEVREGESVRTGVLTPRQGE